MFDEINEENMDELKKKFEKMTEEGTLGSCPNMSHLPDSEKQKVIQGVMGHCGEMLMKTYLSLGIIGQSTVGMEDGFSGNQYLLTFKAGAKDETDPLFGRAGGA